VKAKVTQYSQVNRAKEALGRAVQPVIVAKGVPEPMPVTHGFQGVITMTPVQVLDNGEVRFCNMYREPQPVLVHEVAQRGDHGHLSETFDLSGLNFPQPGAYRVHKVRLTTNGSNRFTETPETQYEYLGEPTLG